jgi:hypothetical protein
MLEMDERNSILRNEDQDEGDEQNVTNHRRWIAKAIPATPQNQKKEY